MSVDTLVLSKLTNVRGKAPHWRAVCPAHESKHGTRSLSIFEPDPDRILLRCHAGCSVEAITRAIGVDLSDLFPPRVADDQRKPRIRKPWRASDVLDSLRHELHVAFVVLTDVTEGKPIDDIDRARARVARDRIIATIEELTDAR